jgi:signal transduction histidine kinase/PAS domain-containing protein
MATLMPPDLSIRIALVGCQASTSSVRDALDGWTLPHVVDVASGPECLRDGHYDVAVFADEVSADTVSAVVAGQRDLGVVVRAPNARADRALELLQAGAEDVLLSAEVDPVALRQSIVFAVGRCSLSWRERDAATVVASEARFRTRAERSSEPTVLIDRVGTVLFANPPAERLFGAAAEQLARRALTVPLAWDGPAEVEVRVGDGSQMRRIEMRYEEIVWRQQPAYVATVHEISGRCDDSGRVRRLSWLLRVTSAISQLVAREREPDVLADRACTILAEADELAGAAVVLFSAGGELELAAVAGSCMADGETRAAWGALELGGDATAEACTSAVVTDAGARVSGCDGEQQLDSASMVAIPMHAEGRLAGVLTVWADPAGVLDREAIEQLKALGDDLGAALDGLATGHGGREDGAAQGWHARDGDALATLYEPLQAVNASVECADITASRRAKAREQLLHAQRMEVLGRLAGGVVHDFNNLLHAFSGLSEVLRRCKDPIEHSKRLDELDDLIERGAQLSRQILQLSRRQSPEPVRLDLVAALTTTEALLRRLLRDDVELTLALASEPLWVSIDRGHLDQLLVNFVINAQDAMAYGGPLRLAAARCGDRAVLEIEDGGPGVPESVRERVFEPFFTTKAADHGTGLGLSVVHGVVHQSGGSIEISDSRYGGALFRVSLPLVADPGATAVTITGGEAVPVSPAPAPRVLLVDDHRQVRRGLELMLGRLGCRVVAVDCRAAALGIEAAEPFDVLLTDLVLPDGSGDQLARELDQRWPGIEVVFMSGSPDPSGWPQLSGLSRHVLEKPFAARELERVLRALGALQPRAEATAAW